MTQATRAFGVAAVLAILFGSMTADASRADDPPIKRTELLRADLTGASGKEAVIYIAELMPGAAGGRHTHYGDEFVYVLEGAIIAMPDGKEPFTLKAGEAAHVTPDVVHAARNASDTAPAKVLVMLTMDKGKPLAEPVK